ncbi:olfactory receptor-like protein OLF3 [Hemicordylus capensis]|uniref:olfactory receptor-like protein OLF3 n=1 Tax=Hemicordylus capensis TaxID=884348 RepID=UPI002304C8A7|nr:olfactory receptor-like protein OLF3 [Hemicordylus capensis]
MLGNLLVVMLVQWDSRLHTPMYFFLSNLSGLEICFVSSIVPQMIQDRSGSVNQTSITQVILLGLTSHRRTQIALFVVILIAYLFTMLGNLLVLMLVQLDARLHTPMYFFLSNLSGLEMSLVSTIVPQMLAHLLEGSGRVSLHRCVAQMYIAASLGSTEGLLLGVMAYDRYLAICCPLVYAVAMSKGRCIMLATASWACGFLFPVLFTHPTLKLPFCGPNHINHFSCNPLVLLRLVCADIRQVEVIIFVVSIIVFLAPLSAILTSYGLILMSVVRMRSGTGRSKAFSTCTSHLIVVTLFYGSLIALFLRPQSGPDSGHEKHVSIFYVVITPLLNPVIYTLRNKDVHAAVAKVICRRAAEPKG